MIYELPVGLEVQENLCGLLEVNILAIGGGPGKKHENPY
jgi:hypothetical protein